MISSDLLQEDILTLGMHADEARRRAGGAARVRYQRVHVLRAAEVRDGLMIPAAATEIRLHDTPAALAEALALVSLVTRAAGAIGVRAFSLADLIERAEGGWGELSDVLTQLAAVGVIDFAELPVDRVQDVMTAVRLARSAGLAASRLTVANPVTDPVTLLTRIQDTVGAVGSIGCVLPLPRNVAADKPTTGYEDVRLVALSRLALHDTAAEPPAIAVDWQLYGPKLAQVALAFGADFLDAVPATSDESLGRRRQTAEDVERNIRAAGFEPEEYRPPSAGRAGRPEQGRGV
jgi:aminodeoxyfutalosine synthase